MRIFHALIVSNEQSSKFKNFLILRDFRRISEQKVEVLICVVD